MPFMPRASLRRRSRPGYRGTSARSCGCRRRRFPAAPAELALDLGGVDGVPPVVAQPVLHEADEVGVLALLARQRLLEKIADGLDDLVVELLAIPADVVGLPDPAPL